MAITIKSNTLMENSSDFFTSFISGSKKAKPTCSRFAEKQVSLAVSYKTGAALAAPHYVDFVAGIPDEKPRRLLPYYP